MIMSIQSECIKLIIQNKSYLQSEFGVTEMTLFGSVARGENRPDSDVDILQTLESIEETILYSIGRDKIFISRK